MTSAGHHTMMGGVGAPPDTYDAAVEYIQSTGRQFLNTGFHGSNDIRVTCRFAWNGNVEVGATESFPFLCRRGARRLACVNKLGGYFDFAAMTALSTAAARSDANWHTVVIDTTTGAQSATFDGTVVKTWTATAADETYYPICLCANVNTALPVPDGSANQFGVGKLASLEIVDLATGQTLLSLFAVRKDGDGIMHDAVSGKNFYATGTEPFIAGPDL